MNKKQLEMKLTEMVKNVLKEERPLNNLGDLSPDEKINKPNVQRLPKRIKLDNIRFEILPNSGFVIANEKNKIIIDDETAKKIANLIFRIIGK